MFIRQLQYLVALARHGHFARAAEACHVSQPALSTAVRNLEKELDLTLVRRGRQYEGLTQEGARVVRWAQLMLSSYEAIRQETHDARKNVQGVLRIGAIPTTLPVIPLLTRDALESHGRIRISVRSASADQIARQLLSCEIDIGITFLDGRPMEDFDVFPMFEERYVVAARSAPKTKRKSSISWKEAARLPLCLLTPEMQSRCIVDEAFQAARVLPDVRMESDSIFALYSQIRCSNVCAVLPHSVLALAEFREEICITPLAPPLLRRIGVVVRRQHPRQPIVDVVLEKMLEVPAQGYFDGFISRDYQSIRKRN